MNFAQKMRLIWIDAFLESGQMLRRDDLCAAFDISVPQASKDIRIYLKRHPKKIRYDKSEKGYFRSGKNCAFGRGIHFTILSAQELVKSEL